MHWNVIGPFDNTKRSGFEKIYPPEKNIDFNAMYEGKSGKVKWSEFITANEYGMVDINKAYPGPGDGLKEVTAYAYTEYKATREKMPDELVEQLEPLFEVISHTNIPILKKPGYEADDIMGTLVKKAEKAGLLTYLVTGDKDMMQLVSETTFMYSPGNRFKPTTIYDKTKVKEKWGVGPDGIIEMLALVGDVSDNVPGIDGVGPKTARKLLDQYKNIETILEHADEAKNKRVREGLQNGKELVYLSRE